jgi:hypothetical protein
VALRTQGGVSVLELRAKDVDRGRPGHSLV